MTPLDDDDRRLINHLHGGFPLCAQPYAEVGQQLGLSEQDVMARLDRLLHDGWLTRFGPLFQIEAAGGQFILAALTAPEERFDEGNAIVNAQTEVAHNYRREHRLNMWFVLATSTPEGIGATVKAIEAATGLPVYPFPKEKEYFVEMKLQVRA